MAPSFQTSKFNTGYSFGKLSRRLYESFEASVEDSDGKTYEFHIEAMSYEEAAQKAEQMAADYGCYDIINMNIYSL